MRLIRLEKRPSDWNQLIEKFPNKNLFHESAWLDYMAASYPRTTIDYFEIRRGSELVGLFSATRVKKFVFTTWGSPFFWAYMGPVADPDVNQEELIHLMLAHCKKDRIAQFALCNDWLDPGIMKAAGFSQETSGTHVCPLTGGAAAVWAGMDGTCRTRIRKAEKNGLVVEVATDPEFIDDFYCRFVRILANKGKVPGYQIDRARLLFHHLGSADRLFALRVRHEGRLVGTAYYPHDNKAMYYGDSSYEPDSLPLCPNNLLHWTAMKMAIEKGIPAFNMGGGLTPHRFTQKFGGSVQPLLTYRKSFVPFLDQAREAYHVLKRKSTEAAMVVRNLPGTSQQTSLALPDSGSNTSMSSATCAKPAKIESK